MLSMPFAYTVWQPPGNTYGSPYSVTSKVYSADLMSLRRSGVPGASPFKSIAARGGNSSGDEHLQRLKLDHAIAENLGHPAESPSQLPGAPMWGEPSGYVPLLAHSSGSMRSPARA